MKHLVKLKEILILFTAVFFFSVIPQTLEANLLQAFTIKSEALFPGVRQIQSRSASWEGALHILPSEVVSFSSYETFWLSNLLLASDSRQLHFNNLYFFLKETKIDFQNVLCIRVTFYSKIKIPASGGPTSLDIFPWVSCSLCIPFLSHLCPSLSLASVIFYFWISLYTLGNFLNSRHMRLCQISNRHGKK